MALLSPKPEQHGRLTTLEFWNSYWAERPQLPAEITPDRIGPYLEQILAVFERYLPVDPDAKVLEVGGTPGQYLVWMHRRFGYSCHCLDYSEMGCDMTRRNFELLDIPVQIYNRDILDPAPPVGQFDVVFALGLIEHFDDPGLVVEGMARHVRPGGRLVIGCPSFLGVNRFFMKSLAPALLSQHNLSAMNVRRWTEFEERLGLQRLFRGYVGGFEPKIFNRSERVTRGNRLLKMIAHGLAIFYSDSQRLAPLHRINSRVWSGYVMAVYEVPGVSG